MERNAQEIATPSFVLKCFASSSFSNTSRSYVAMTLDFQQDDHQSFHWRRDAFPFSCACVTADAPSRNNVLHERCRANHRRENSPLS